MNDTLRVLVVDDTVVYRKILADLLVEIPGVEVVGTAANGKIALEKTTQLRPDLLTLDLEMPEVDGLEVLRRLPSTGCDAGAIMLSAFTSQGAKSTIAALEAGAFDFLLKPTGRSIEESRFQLQRDLRTKVTAFARRRGVRQLLNGSAGADTPKVRPPLPAIAPQSASPSYAPSPAFVQSGDTDVVVLGISTGGPKALTEMLPRLPAEFPVPILIVQHMPPVFTRSLADDLNGRCKLRVMEAEEGQEVAVGTILIAPGGRHMGLRREAGRVVARITDDPPECSCRPSVDYLFRAAAEIYGKNTLAVIMTGMGSDGTAGCHRLKRLGARIIAQDEATCVVFGMPREPIVRGLVDVVAPLDRIAAEIVRLAGRRSLACR